MLRRALGALLDDATQALVHLGKRLGYPALATVPISAVMLSRLETIHLEQPLDEVAQLLVAGDLVQLPIVEHGAPVGVVTREDVAAGVERSGPHSRVGEAPRHEVVTVTPSDSLADVFDKLRRASASVAIVVDRGTPVGLVTVDRLLAYVERSREAA